MGREPLGESDFLHCSTGCRPGRSTMAGLALLDSSLNARGKFFWRIEGDIRAACASIPQGTVLTLLAERGAARRRLALIAAWLKAGLRQGQLLHRTALGTPQGAIGAPGLSHVSRHQLDVSWWTHSGGLHRQVTERRRHVH
jgi:RNA-directed DNA polymerase